MAIIKLIYFKKSGKYYSDSAYTSSKTDWHSAIKEVKQKQKDGDLPGLVAGGGQEFTILVNMEGIDHPVPQLIHPIRD